MGHAFGFQRTARGVPTEVIAIAIIVNCVSGANPGHPNLRISSHHNGYHIVSNCPDNGKVGYRVRG